MFNVVSQDNFVWVDAVRVEIPQRCLAMPEGVDLLVYHVDFVETVACPGSKKSQISPAYEKIFLKSALSGWKSAATIRCGDRKDASQGSRPAMRPNGMKMACWPPRLGEERCTRAGQGSWQ